MEYIIIIHDIGGSKPQITTYGYDAIPIRR